VDIFGNRIIIKVNLKQVIINDTGHQL